ncbi:MAG: hypothetical protein A3I44_06315 [Candidatus Sungbacteria bacterium RIFCSPLOWO2_02_FULL_51_17]|uniref:ATP synthase F1 complex delta/epsilon subunit N-terminal domain-containing protein n=1 Tax=Candidatus Sungbacteria bacterium RIFCSPHIGHO2_02_FULL_51_29 TaxID=1802273 RepID=A0A1G2KU63_9BACT|nr:MAG: hypothetical protein A2676_04630 [Candidatus Sungbacteria bacterium RIFCSPHIGHO2_01_FULL_51_22]OHA02152.1 MAG: hypothetical protein A3C16_05485 [Candidatus Sungbacteria bacterium RIFCSPHIGHO2_02_FULL_51_29]OHA06451.1 MAG: hypothetical protein A3B29_04780 [Candidatus Sungbacteria bacterium RIFCSPLOWO2_01_FULL_51_34]OHA10389.1 MAG: hypothetical protein A3I44_06315 [Candidatus Sungbacteria bacterium RIFCSPLOWO2_02_FULL_51_17]
MNTEKTTVTTTGRVIVGRVPDLKVVVRDREGVLYEGVAQSVTSYNTTGEFDILPLHANFISIITGKIIIRSEGISARTIQLQTGILKVSENTVEVYLGILR